MLKLILLPLLLMTMNKFLDADKDSVLLTHSTSVKLSKSQKQFLAAHSGSQKKLTVKL